MLEIFAGWFSGLFAVLIACIAGTLAGSCLDKHKYGLAFTLAVITIACIAFIFALLGNALSYEPAGY